MYILGRASQHLRSLAPEMMMEDYDGQMIFGDLVGLKLPDIRLTGEEKPQKKTSPRKLVPTGDRTGARCVISAHATTCSTAVDSRILISMINIEGKNVCLSWDLNLRSPVLRTGVLLFDHWNTDARIHNYGESNQTSRYLVGFTFIH